MASDLDWDDSALVTAWNDSIRVYRDSHAAGDGASNGDSPASGAASRQATVRKAAQPSPSKVFVAAGEGAQLDLEPSAAGQATDQERDGQGAGDGPVHDGDADDGLDRDLPAGAPDMNTFQPTRGEDYWQAAVAFASSAHQPPQAVGAYYTAPDAHHLHHHAHPPPPPPPLSAHYSGYPGAASNWPHHVGAVYTHGYGPVYYAPSTALAGSGHYAPVPPNGGVGTWGGAGAWHGNYAAGVEENGMLGALPATPAQHSCRSRRSTGEADEGGDGAGTGGAPVQWTPDRSDAEVSSDEGSAVNFYEDGRALSADEVKRKARARPAHARGPPRSDTGTASSRRAARGGPGGLGERAGARGRAGAEGEGGVRWGGGGAGARGEPRPASGMGGEALLPPLPDMAGLALEEADEDLANLMLAWYYTGFYTARFLASR